jgi:protein TonB
MALLASSCTYGKKKQDEAVDPNKTYAFFEVDDKPEVLKKVSPTYPDLARRAGIEGQVVCEIIVGKNGDVEEITAKKSIPLLDEAAVTAVKQWKFEPARMHGVIVKCRMMVPVFFKLR